MGVKYTPWYAFQIKRRITSKPGASNEVAQALQERLQRQMNFRSLY